MAIPDTMWAGEKIWKQKKNDDDDEEMEEIQRKRKMNKKMWNKMPCRYLLGKPVSALRT